MLVVFTVSVNMFKLEIGLCPALTPTTHQQLISVEVQTILQFLAQDLDQLSMKTRIAFRDLLSIKRFLIAQHSCTLVSGLQLYENILSSICILPTGCSALDELLEGGIYTGEITELQGTTGCGKTQICLSVVKTVASELKKNIIYFDSGGQFSATRIVQMMTAAGMEVDEQHDALKRINIIKVFDVFDLFAELEKTRSELYSCTNGFYKSLKLIVFDCLTSLIAPLLGGLQTVCNGFVVQLSRAIKSISVDFALGVLLTGNIVGVEHAGKAMQNFCRVWCQTANTRLEILYTLNYSKIELSSVHAATRHKRMVKLVKSSRQANGTTVQITVNDSGLEVFIE